MGGKCDPPFWVSTCEIRIKTLASLEILNVGFPIIVPTVGLSKANSVDKIIIISPLATVVIQKRNRNSVFIIKGTEWPVVQTLVSG